MCKFHAPSYLSQNRLTKKRFGLSWFDKSSVPFGFNRKNTVHVSVHRFGCCCWTVGWFWWSVGLSCICRQRMGTHRGNFMGTNWLFNRISVRIHSPQFVYGLDQRKFSFRLERSLLPSKCGHHKTSSPVVAQSRWLSLENFGQCIEQFLLTIHQCIVVFHSVSDRDSGRWESRGPTTSSISLHPTVLPTE
jgi:hypothetical protein